MAMLPEQTYTVQQFIDSGADTLISYDSLSLFENGDSGLIACYNVLNDYIDELKDASVILELSDSEYLKYLYKPKLLSYDIYNSSELYFIILYLNNLYNVKDFNLKKIKVLKKDILEYALSSIYNAELDNVKDYNNRRIQQE